MTLFDAYTALDRAGEGLAMLDEALEKRPDDGRLMLFASGKFSAYNRPERAAALLEGAREKSSNTAWLREAARQATRRGELAEAEALWLQVIAAQPLVMDAQRSYVQILAESRGLGAALDYLEETCAKFPSNVPLHELYVDWLNDEGPVRAEPVIRHVLDQSPTNNWARRELVLNLIRQGRTEDAISEGALMVEAAPNESYSHSIIGHAYRAEGDEERASASFRRALELSADNSNAVRGVVRGAKTDAARREALALVAAEIKRQVIFGEALSAFREEAFPILEPEELLASLREIHAERPDLWQSWAALADQLKAVGDGAGALELVEAMVERFPLRPRAYLELAEVHEFHGDLPAMIKALQGALDVNPHWTYARRQLGRAHEKLGEFERARELFEQAVAEDPLGGANYGYLAGIQWRLEDRDAAFDTLSKAVAVQPTYRWGWETLADYARDLDREDEALAMAQKLTEMRPQEKASWEIVADMLGTFRRHEDQLEALDQGIALHPRTNDFYDAKAYALVQMGRYDEALEACRPEIYGDEPPRTLRGRGAWVLWQKGDRKAAMEKMELLVEDEPDYYWAIKIFCDWCHEEEAHDKALIWAPRLVRLAPEDAVAHGYIGHALEQSEKKEEACESYSRAYQIDPDYTFAGYSLFDLQIELGHLDAAEATLEKLLVHMPDRYSLGRKLILEAKRKHAEAALEVHAQIAADKEVSVATLEWVDGELDQVADKARVTSHYGRLVSGGSVNRTAAERWIARSVNDGAVRVYEQIAGLPEGSELRRAAWVTYFEEMAQRGEKDSKRGMEAIRAYRDELAGPTETWEQVGYYLVSEKRHKENIAWMADWRRRDDLCQWGMLHLARSFEAKGRLGEAADIRRWALENLEADHSAPTHRVMVAFSVAAHPGGQEFDQLVGEIDPDDLNGYYRFCFEMAHVVRQLRPGGEGRKAAKLAYRRAIEAEPEWEDWRVLAKVHNLALRRSFLRALPALFAFQMLRGTCSSLINFFKQ